AGRRLQERRLRLGAGRDRGAAAALERERGDAGQALEFEANVGVVVDRNRFIDRDSHENLLRVLRIEREAPHLADADAVEHHGAAGAKAVHRAVEGDLVIAAIAAAARALEPVDEAERAGDHHQREQSDQGVVRPGLHRGSLYLANYGAAAAGSATGCAARERLPRK